MNGDKTKIRTIVYLPREERRRLLETAAERAAFDHQSDKELVAFTELDGVVHDQPLRTGENCNVHYAGRK